MEHLNELLEEIHERTIKECELHRQREQLLKENHLSIEYTDLVESHHMELADMERLQKEAEDHIKKLEKEVRLIDEDLEERDQ